MLRTMQLSLSTDRTYASKFKAAETGADIANQLTGAVNVIIVPVEKTDGSNRYTPVFCCFQDTQEAVKVANMGFQVFA